MPEKKRLTKLPTIRRMPMYLRMLNKVLSEGMEHVSSNRLADELDLEAIVVRKDLAVAGILGKPRVGFEVKLAIEAIEQFMNFNSPTDAVLVGTGHLGQALLGYSGFVKFGLNIVAAFDSNPDVIGTTLYDKPVYPMSEFTQRCEVNNIQIGILCVPGKFAQEVADMMVSAGLKGIWNFTPRKLNVPPEVVVQREDLAEGLAELSVKLSRMAQE